MNKIMKENVLLMLSETLSIELRELETLSSTEDLRLVGLDSLKAVEIIIYIEDMFDCEVSDTDFSIDSVSTIDNIIMLFEKYST